MGTLTRHGVGTLKQFAGSLSVLDHFVGLALKGLKELFEKILTELLVNINYINIELLF